MVCQPIQVTVHQRDGTPSRNDSSTNGAVSQCVNESRALFAAVQGATFTHCASTPQRHRVRTYVFRCSTWVMQQRQVRVVDLWLIEIASSAVGA